MSVDKSLVSGSTGMLLLKLLSEKDMYGYEMIETLRERSQNVFELKAGTLYPLLHSMEEKKLLTAYEKEVGSKVRKYYSITGQGRKVLAEKQDEWKTYAQAVLSVLEAGGVETGNELDRIHRPKMAWGMIALIAVLSIVGYLAQCLLQEKWIAAGGTGMVMTYMMLGLLLSIYRYQNTAPERKMSARLFRTSE